MKKLLVSRKTTRDHETQVRQHRKITRRVFVTKGANRREVKRRGRRFEFYVEITVLAAETVPTLVRYLLAFVFMCIVVMYLQAEVVLFLWGLSGNKRMQDFFSLTLATV